CCCSRCGPSRRRCTASARPPIGSHPIDPASQRDRHKRRGPAWRYETVDYWVLLLSLVLILLPAVVLTSSISRPARAWVCRIAFVVSVAMMVAPSIWLQYRHAVPARAALFLVTGAFAGGIVLSAATAGIVEDNAPPSAPVQRRVLAYHAGSAVQIRPDPLG